MTTCSSANGWRSRLAFGAFDGEELIGYVEGSPESWNNRFRISNICVFENAKRGSGVGTKLLDAIETQSCNENAIALYRKNGFEMIGFDLYAYSNDDPERHEVRFEMGKKLK